MAKTTKQPKASADLTAASSTGGALVLQWLTYAFWGWAVASLTWLIGVLLVNAILDEEVSAVLPYAIAATLVLFPLAFVCDLFYRRLEPLRKSGAAMVIMLIHAVIFALIAIGALILTVFLALNTAMNEVDDGANGALVAIYTALSAAVLYGLAFLRTLNPFKQKRGANIFAWGMLGLAIVLLIASVVGPVMKTAATRDDRAIETALGTIHGSVQDYVYANNGLPKSIEQLNFTSERTKEIALEDVTYTAGDVVANEFSPEMKQHRYQLCVNYDHKSKNDSYSSSRSNTGEYDSYPTATPHDAGRVCYKLYVSQ